MVPLVAATFLVAGVGVALTPYVLLAEDIDLSRRWDPMPLLVQAAALVVALAAIAVRLRRRAAADTKPVEAEVTA